MAKIIKFNPRGEGPEKRPKKGGEEGEKPKGEKTIKVPAKGGEKKSPLKGTLENAKPLTQEDFDKLFEALREGLKRLYPSQVEEVLGFTGLGEKNGNKAFAVGLVIWKRYGVEQLYTSTAVLLFENNKLKKVSFLEAKNNYWDWRTMIKLHKGEFHTEEIFNRFMELVRGQFRV